MPDVIDALITFTESFEQDGLGPDGLPLFRPVVKITKAKPPLTSVTRVAHEGDFEQFPEPYRMFQKEHAARAQAEGYPLVLWPVISPADLKMCAVRDITTVEQLAALAGRKADDVLPHIKELALRAKRMVELQGKVGKFEAIITDLTGQRDALAEQLREAHATISAQNSLLAQMQARPGRAA